MGGEPGIVIVTYNSAGVLAGCLESALAQSPHVVVVDNASADDTCQIARRSTAQLIANQENRGFAGAVNQGVAALQTRSILLLNPDARLLTPLAPMLQRLAQPHVGAVGGRLVEEDGGDQTGFAIRAFPTPAALIFESLGINRLWPRNPVNKRYRKLDADLELPQQAEQPAGAFLLFSRTVWTALGGFDERFHPLWFEDVDFLRRLSNAGYQTWYEPAVQAVHAGGHSVQDLQPSDRQRFWYGNLLRYAGSHFRSDLVIRLLAASVVVGVGIRRLSRGWARGSSRQRGSGAVGLAWSYMVHGRQAGRASADGEKR